MTSLEGSAAWEAGTFLECRVTSGDIVVGSGDSLVVDGHGGPKIKLVITSSSTLVNNGAINLTVEGILVNNSTFSNIGTVVNSRFIENSGTINNDGGEISGCATTNSGAIDNSSTFKNQRVIFNNGTINNSGVFENSGTLYNDCSGVVNGVITGNPPVANCNNPPLAFDQLVSTDVNTSISLELNAIDPDNTDLTFSIVTPPLHGVLSGTAPDIIYTPMAQFAGVDSFTLKVSDGEFDSNIATISIIIKDPAASGTGNNGMIAFTRIFGGNDDIFIMNADGTGQKNMTSTLGYFESYPTWSPDGTKIAFTRDTGAGKEIFEMNTDGTNQVQLTDNPDVTDHNFVPDWSPDGTK